MHAKSNAAQPHRWWAAAVTGSMCILGLAYAILGERPAMAQTAIDFPLSCTGSTPFEFGGITVTKTNPGVSEFTFTFTIDDPDAPTGTATVTTQATLNLNESASPYFSGDDDDDILTLTISVNNNGTFETSDFQNFCSDVQGGGPIEGLSVEFPKECPSLNPMKPFEIATFDLKNIGTVEVEVDFEWEIGGEHYGDTTSLRPGDTETFNACDLIGNASNDVVIFRVLAVTPPQSASDLKIENFFNDCRDSPCDSLGTATACNLGRKTFPGQRAIGMQEATTASLIRHSSAGTVTVNAQWNAKNVAGQDVVVQACTESSPMQCGNITINQKVTKLLRFEFPPFPDCSQGNAGGIESFCLSRVDAPPGSVKAIYSRTTKRDICN